ncbi:DUF4304 domain-containing protein [Sphingobacterium sp. UME9]|uniref:DUF4304 domain-containing protein n=1 Tax=Sphingobacterium sp. UME9 TaxID=1862316 RepID=UPI0015FEE74B|nr:DUF4304 domain-containing protein [Sphingobacterium sp. UME9]MBB1646714.1 hypothetical protein [Sphingobacterium sp. UME9]
MNKIKFKQAIDQILLPHKFVRNKNTWILKSPEVNKVISVYQSNYANTYYIDYGFIINNLELNDLNMHVFKRLGSSDYNEQISINSVLSLNSSMSEHERVSQLKVIIEDRALSVLEKINTASDLSEYIQGGANLNMIPLVVKNYFHLTNRKNVKMWVAKISSVFGFNKA